MPPLNWENCWKAKGFLYPMLISSRALGIDNFVLKKVQRLENEECRTNNFSLAPNTRNL